MLRPLLSAPSLSSLGSHLLAGEARELVQEGGVRVDVLLEVEQVHLPRRARTHAETDCEAVRLVRRYAATPRSFGRGGGAPKPST